MLSEQLGGKRLRFNDAQRRRLAVRAKKLGLAYASRIDHHRHSGHAAGLAPQAAGNMMAAGNVAPDVCGPEMRSNGWWSAWPWRTEIGATRLAN